MTITPVKKQDNTFKLQAELTKGQLIAVRNALAAWGTPVATNVKDALEIAAHKIQLNLN